MYALVITDKKGAPPGWVQDGMYIATWALTISGAMCLALGTVMAKVETDYDGNVVNKFTNRFIHLCSSNPLCFTVASVRWHCDGCRGTLWYDSRNCKWSRLLLRCVRCSRRHFTSLVS